MYIKEWPKYLFHVADVGMLEAIWHDSEGTWAILADQDGVAWTVHVHPHRGSRRAFEDVEGASDGR